MANPFEDTLDEVIVYTGSTLVASETLQFLMGGLSNQEDKAKALDRGLAQSLVAHYDKAVGNSANDSIRQLIVEMLSSLAQLQLGRQVLLGPEIGKAKLLSFLEDAAVNVRAASAKLLSTFSVSPDVKAAMLEDRVVFQALVNHLLNDELVVGRETIPALAQLSMKDPNLDEPTMRRLLELLKEENLRLGVSQTIWNSCAEHKEKELAIACGAVPAFTKLLGDQDNNIRRLASGALMAITVAEKGKVAVIEENKAIKSLTSLVLDPTTEPNVRVNAAESIRNLSEHPKGLVKCGAALLVDPQIMLEILPAEQVARVLDPLIGNEEDVASLQALSTLVRTRDGRLAALNMLEIVERLFTLTQSRAMTVRGLSKKCLKSIISDNDDARAVFEAIPKSEADEAEMGADTVLSPATTALLLVQFQNDFTHAKGVLNGEVKASMEDTHAMWHSIEVVEAARKLGVMVIHAPLQFAAGDYAAGPLKVMSDTQAFTPGTFGAEICDELKPEGNDLILQNMTGLSAFQGTDLESILKTKGITTLAVGGMMGDAAVEHTGRTAYEKGLAVLALEDCIASSSVAAHKVFLQTSVDAFGEALGHRQFLKMLVAS